MNNDKGLVELPVPPVATDAERPSMEIARIWIDGKDQGMTMMINAFCFEEPGVWGIALCDQARHIADAYVDSAKRDLGDDLDEDQENLLWARIIGRIKEYFDAEWDNATSSRVCIRVPREIGKAEMDD